MVAPRERIHPEGKLSDVLQTPATHWAIQIPNQRFSGHQPSQMPRRFGELARLADVCSCDIIVSMRILIGARRDENWLISVNGGFRKPMKLL